MNKKFWGILSVIILIIISIILVIQYIMALTQEIKNPILSLEIEEYGTVKIELYPEYAPNTVKNIIALAQKGYYDGKVFYGTDEISVYIGRNEDGQIDYPRLSTLDENISDANDFEYEIKGEFIANGFNENTLKHEKGVVSMIRADYTQVMGNLQEESYNSASSQFTILTENARSLNGMYAAFGKVVEGMEIVESIYDIEKQVSEEEESSVIEKFITMPKIIKATIETYGVNYGMPQVHEAFDYEGYMNEMLTQYYSENNQ